MDPSEGKRIAYALGDTKAVILRNHGLLTSAGRSKKQHGGSSPWSGRARRSSWPRPPARRCPSRPSTARVTHGPGRLARLRSVQFPALAPTPPEGRAGPVRLSPGASDPPRPHGPRRPPGSDPSARKLRAVAHRVLVVGGGVIGLSCAWRLATGGHEVTLVAPTPGHDGASWVAAGMLAPVTEVQFGEAALTELLLEGARGWKEYGAALEEASGHDVGYDQSGTLTVALDTSDRAALDQLLAYQHTLGCTAHRRTASECRGLVPALSPTVCGGIEVPGDHHVDNRALLGALVAACAATGVSFVGQTVRCGRRRTDRAPLRRRPARRRSRPPGGRRRYPAHRRPRRGRTARDPPRQGPHPAAGTRRRRRGRSPAAQPHGAGPRARAFDLPRPPPRQHARRGGHHGGEGDRRHRARRGGARTAQ